MAKISKVWMHFDKINKLSAKCKICPTAGNTSNLQHSHLNNVHNHKTKTLKSNVLEKCADEHNVDDPDSVSTSQLRIIMYLFYAWKHVYYLNNSLFLRF